MHFTISFQNMFQFHFDGSIYQILTIKQKGNIINLTIAIQRRTGNVLGYALIEFETRDEAQKAINNTNGKEFMESPLSVDFSFVAPPKIAKTNRNNNRNSKRRR